MRVFEWIRKSALREPMTLAEAESRADDVFARSRDFETKLRQRRGRGATHASLADLTHKEHNRLVLGALRYERLGTGHYDAIGSACARLARYQIDGNREHLVDVLNLVRIEWVRPVVEGARWFGCIPLVSPPPRLGRLRPTAVEEAIASLVAYRGGYPARELLVDAANFVLCEWCVPANFLAHWDCRVDPSLHAKEIDR